MVRFRCGRLKLHSNVPPSLRHRVNGEHDGANIAPSCYGAEQESERQSAAAAVRENQCRTMHENVCMT